jgi:hypothetical protein
MNTDPKSPDDPKSREENTSPDLLAGWNCRSLRLVFLYSDPTSPAYGNKAKAAELAPYKGLPGSNQLAVQGNRTIARARRHPGLSKLLIDTDCTLERAFERVSACLDAKNERVLLTKDGQVVHVEAGANHAIQLQAAKLVIDLHGVWDLVHQETGSANPAPEDSGQITVPDDLTAEEQELQRQAKAMDSRSRILTREAIAAEEDVIRAKAKLAAMEDAAGSGETENRSEEGEHHEANPGADPASN